MASLGKPLPALIGDAKVMSRFGDSLASGELFAEASLASELLVLLVTNISRDDFHKYIGRGQFPKIMNKPVVPKNKKGQYTREDLNKWANLLTKFDYFLTILDDSKKTEIGNEIELILPTITRFMLENYPIGNVAKFGLAHFCVRTLMQLNDSQIIMLSP